MIVAPDCASGQNKTLPGEVFEKLGSDVTVAVFAGYCNFIGSIPDELGLLPNMELLFLYQNHLSGTIPPSLGLLASLEYLSLGFNNLIGGIPPSFGDLTQLELLGLNHNALTGGVPLEVIGLYESSMVNFYVYDNNLSGNLTLNLRDYQYFADYTDEQIERKMEQDILRGNNFTLVSP